MFKCCPGSPISTCDIDAAMLSIDAVVSLVSWLAMSSSFSGSDSSGEFALGEGVGGICELLVSYLCVVRVCALESQVACVVLPGKRNALLKKPRVGD